MQLNEFIANTLEQIIEGVYAAQTCARDKEAKINPCGTQLVGSSRNVYLNDHNNTVGQLIEFDVAITVKEEGETKGKAGIFVSVLQAGMEGKKAIENIAVNRIKFAIPIFLPNQN